MSSGQQDTVLEAIIPQDKTSGVNRQFYGYTLGEVLLVGLPPFVFLYITSTIMGAGFAQWNAVGTLAIATVLFIVVKITPWYNTPLEILSRSIDYVRARTRMPLVENEAADVPGVVDIHEEYDAIELEDGSLAAVIEVPLINTSTFSGDQYLGQVSQFANALNSTIARQGGSGFDVDIHISQSIPSVSHQIESLKDAAQDGVPVEQGGMPSYARKYAEEQTENILDQLEEENVMQRSVHMITAVDPAETNDSGNIIDEFSSLSIVRPSSQQYDTQAAVLDERVRSMKSAVQGFSNPRRLDADELAQLNRDYWLDTGTDLQRSNLRSDEGPVMNLGVAVDGDEHARSASEEDSETIQPRSTDVSEPAVADGGAAAATSPDGENTPDGSGEDDSVTDADAETEGDSDGRFGGRLSSARKKITSVTNSLRGHASESTRKQMVYSPAYVDEYGKYVEVGDQYMSSIWVTGWPKHPEEGLLESILSVPEIRYDISLSLKATDYHDKLDELESLREKITSSAIEKEDSGGSGADASALAADVQVLREQMQDNDLECFEVGMTITVRSGSLDAVKRARRRIAGRCSAVNISTTTASNRQLAAVRTTSPLPTNNLREETRIDTTFNMTSDGVACLFPFSGYYIVEREGTTYGLVKTGVRDSGDTLGMLQVNRLNRTSPHRFWVGRSGSGKSFDIKNHINEEMARDRTESTVIVDIARGFDGPVETYNGSKVIVGETTINPFEIRPPKDARGTEESLDDKVRLLTDMFQIYMMENAPEEEAQAIRSTISKTVRETYKTAGPEDDDIGITNDPSTHDKESPVMEDYFKLLADMEENTREYTYQQTDSEVDALKDDIKVLMNRLKEFQPGQTYDYLSGKSEADMYDRVVYFDMNKFENDSSAAKGMMMTLITSHAYELAKQTEGHVNVVVDEAHDLFRDAAQADQLESMVRAGRNTGLMFDFISQAGEDFDAGAAKVIAKQCSIAIWRDLGEMGASVPQEFGLEQEQAQVVSGELATGDNEALDYSEALVDVESDRYLIERRVSDYAARIVDYRESEDGDFDAYMAGKSLKEQRAEAGRKKARELYAHYELIEEILSTVRQLRNQDVSWTEIETAFANNEVGNESVREAVAGIRPATGTVEAVIDGQAIDLNPKNTVKENADRFEREAERIEKEAEEIEHEEQTLSSEKREERRESDEETSVGSQPNVLGAAHAYEDVGDVEDDNDPAGSDDSDGGEQSESEEPPLPDGSGESDTDDGTTDVNEAESTEDE